MDEISRNNKEQLISALKHFGIYSLPLDEITDIADNTNSIIKAFLQWQ